MKLDEKWANLLDNDQHLLIELMAAKIEIQGDAYEPDYFVEGMRYVLELLQDKTKLTQDSFTLFEDETFIDKELESK